MRLFVGVEVNDQVRRLADEAVTALRREIPERMGARWVPLDNLHLTVRFIGHVPDDRVAAVLESLEAPLVARAFDIEFSGCGRFPPSGAPRVLWIGLQRGLEPLRHLHDTFNARLRPFGYDPEPRPFSAHLTLARFKDARGRDARLVDEALTRLVTRPVVQPVERVIVFESRLSPKGPRYLPVRAIPLTPP
jgi:RNA 2',3'-cyclic 3'-phosphodiesterase